MPDPKAEAYRSASAQVSAAAAILAAQALPVLVKPGDISSFDAWVDRVLPVVLRAAQRNSEVSRRFYEILRDDEDFHTTMPAWQPVIPEPERVRSSLYATAGQELQDIETFDLKRAQTAARGAVIRHTMNAGRDSVIATAIADPEAIGCLYITRGDAKVCYWCAMLASRGPQFKGNSFADSDMQFEGPGSAKVHDHCRCILVPVKSVGGSERAQASRDLFEEWKAVNYENGRIKHSGKDAVRAWRRYWVEKQKSAII